jgi:transposase
MRDTEFVRDLLRLQAPWEVQDAKIDFARRRVDVVLAWQGPGLCPMCNKESPKHDHREREWRDLDMCSDQLYIVARVPRVECSEHGLQSVAIPWAKGRSEFTDRFERLVILFLREMSIAAVARRTGLSWDSIDGIMQRAVTRGMSERKAYHPRFIGIDEKATKKRHHYFTIVSDLQTGTVLWIGRDRKKETLNAFWDGLSAEQLNGIEGVAMDMWKPFFESTIAKLPDAGKKIVFDKFHIMAYLSKAVDKTRRATLRSFGADASSLKGTKYDWLRNVSSMGRTDRQEFTDLRKEYTTLGRAWSIKESFQHFWSYHRESIARRYFDEWYYWATHSRIPAIIEVAKMLKRHLSNILTYLKLRITNGRSESLNSKIQWIKYQARGFRSLDRFERAIMFHCGGLNLLPSHHNS